MSCAILNTMKLCIIQAQTDISGEKRCHTLMEGGERKRGEEGAITSPPPKFYERLHKGHISNVHNQKLFSRVLIGRGVAYKLIVSSGVM